MLKVHVPGAVSGTTTFVVVVPLPLTGPTSTELHTLSSELSSDTSPMWYEPLLAITTVTVRPPATVSGVPAGGPPQLPLTVCGSTRYAPLTDAAGANRLLPAWLATTTQLAGVDVASTWEPRRLQLTAPGASANVTGSPELVQACSDWTLSGYTWVPGAVNAMACLHRPPTCPVARALQAGLVGGGVGAGGVGEWCRVA